MGDMPDVVSVQEVYTVMLISLKPGLCCFINSINLISYLTPLCSLFLISNTEDKAYLTNSPLCYSELVNMKTLRQRSPTFVAPGTNFHVWGVGVGWGMLSG